MIISDFTKPELDYLRENCNFVRYEKDVFEMRSEGFTLSEIAYELNLSIDWVRRISVKVNKKINLVLQK